MASHAAARTAPQGGPDPDRQALWRGAGSRSGSGVPLPGDASVGPHPKTATVERRERSRSPRDRVVARRRRDRKNECACRRSIHPSFGVDANKNDATRMPQGAAGRTAVAKEREACVSA